MYYGPNTKKKRKEIKYVLTKDVARGTEKKKERPREEKKKKRKPVIGPQ